METFVPVHGDEQFRLPSPEKKERGEKYSHKTKQKPDTLGRRLLKKEKQKEEKGRRKKRKIDVWRAYCSADDVVALFLSLAWHARGKLSFMCFFTIFVSV